MIAIQLNNFVQSLDLIQYECRDLNIEGKNNKIQNPLDEMEMCFNYV